MKRIEEKKVHCLVKFLKIIFIFCGFLIISYIILCFPHKAAQFMDSFGLDWKARKKGKKIRYETNQRNTI